MLPKPWRFFQVGEFDSHDGTPVPENLMTNLDLLVRGVLDPLRERWGGPLVVISGWRSPEHNARVGGAKFSYHLTAMAADIRPLDVRAVPIFWKVVRDMHEAGQLPRLGGLGQYPRWTHVDVGKAKDGHLRRWMGNGLGSERTSG